MDLGKKLAGAYLFLEFDRSHYILTAHYYFVHILSHLQIFGEHAVHASNKLVAILEAKA